MQVEVANVSTKGQVVIPGPIRKQLGIGAGSKMLVITDGENVLMKPLTPPAPQAFDHLIEESRQAAAEAGIAPTDLARTIEDIRRARRH